MIARMGPALLAASHPHRHPLRRAAGGFSLVEMMVVIGIIVLLVGLTVAVLGSLSRGAETRQTQDMFTVLEKAYEEWKNVAERDITYGINDQPMAGVTYEIAEQTVDAPPGTGDDHEPTDELISDLMANAQCKAMLANLSNNLLKKHAPPSDEVTALDAWETEVITVFPGRLWVAGFDPGTQPDNPDGTIQTDFEDVFGVCVGRRVRFVSAGPDGQFGNLTAADGTPAREEANDNIYSYPLEAP
jgi:type II secretory pathway pseudopilin PulG